MPSTEQSGRTYRSKKQRPCDLCRSRKTHCRIQGSGGTCALCLKLDRCCTFLHKPAKRTLKPRANDSTDNGPGDSFVNDLPLNSPQDNSALMDLLMPFEANTSEGTIGEDLWLPQIDPHEPFGIHAASQPMQVDCLTTGLPSIEAGRTEAHSQDRELPNTVLPQNDQSPSHLHSPSGSDLSLYVALPSTSGRTRSSRSCGDVGLAEDCRLDERARHSTNFEEHLPDLGQPISPNAFDWSSEFSLNSKKGYSHQLIGLSCESDPYLLRSYYYNEYDTYPMFRLDFRKMTNDTSVQPHLRTSGLQSTQLPTGSSPVQFVMTHEDIWRDSVKSVQAIQSGANTEEGDLELLNKAVPIDLGARLLKLYVRFVHPRFPVLDLSDLSRMPCTECDVVYPIGIQSAAYALAAPFAFLDDELSVLRGYVQIPTEELWAIAHRSYERACCFSHLSSLQLCLMLLQMPPPNCAVAEPLSTWALSCSSLSLAESLGVNLDPSEWRLPRKEIMLRKRLWWFTYMQHVWQAIVIARPSHLNDENWDVSKLTAEDFESDQVQDPTLRTLTQRHITFCLVHCELSIIAADVLKEFYTLKAVRKSSSLSVLLNRARPLRTRIESWRQTLPLLSKAASALDDQELADGAFLRLSHLTIETLIFRALLRPLFYQAVPADDATREPISTIFQNCYTCAKVATEVLSALKAEHFVSFWHPYARYYLCYVSSFILLTLTHSPTMEIAQQNNELLNTWRKTLRTQSRAWPLARLATIRLDAAVWKGLSLAVHGAGEDSPAVRVTRGQLNSGEITAQPGS